MGTGKGRNVQPEELTALIDGLLQTYGTYRDVAEAYTERFGGNPETVSRQLARVRQGQHGLREAMVDRLCILKGWHLSFVK